MQVQCLMKMRIARHASSEGRIEGQMCVRLVGPRDASRGCGLTFARPANRKCSESWRQLPRPSPKPAAVHMITPTTSPCHIDSASCAAKLSRYAQSPVSTLRFIVSKRPNHRAPDRIPARHRVSFFGLTPAHAHPYTCTHTRIHTHTQPRSLHTVCDTSSS
jgi:hypothetical protein